MPSASSGCRRRASSLAAIGAHLTRRSGSISARSRRPRSRSRSLAQIIGGAAQIGGRGTRREGRRGEMKFGFVPLAEAVGAISAHAVRAGEVVLQQGLAGDARSRRASRGGGRRRASSRRGSTPTTSAEDEAAAAPRREARRPACPRRAAFHRPRQSLRRGGRRAGARPRRASTASTPSTRPSPSRPCRPSGPSRRARWSATVKIIPYAVPARLARGGDRRRRGAAHPRRAFRQAAGRRRLDLAAGTEAVGRRQDARRAAQRLAPARRLRDLRRAACRMRRRRSPRRFGAPQRPIPTSSSSSAPRRSPTGATSSRPRVEAAGGAHRASRHAGRSRQPPAARPARRSARARRAGLRPLPQGERLRLGAAAPARRPARRPRRHRRHGRRRPSHGDRRRARSRAPSRPDHEGCGGRPRGRTLDPHGSEQAARRDRRRDAHPPDAPLGPLVPRAPGHPGRRASSARSSGPSSRGSTSPSSSIPDYAEGLSTSVVAGLAPCRRRPTAPSSASATCR